MLCLHTNEIDEILPAICRLESFYNMEISKYRKYLQLIKTFSPAKLEFIEKIQELLFAKRASLTPSSSIELHEVHQTIPVINQDFLKLLFFTADESFNFNVERIDLNAIKDPELIDRFKQIILKQTNITKNKMQN